MCSLTLIARWRCVDALFIIMARGHLYFHRTLRDRTALDGTTLHRATVLDSDCSVVVDRCRPDFEGGPLIRLLFRPTNLLSGLFAN